MIKALGCFVALLTLAAPSSRPDRPNIIFLMSDDQTTWSLGCMGNPDVKTPNIDGLARDGMLFNNHYDTTAICMGSRATVMTGMYEYKTGCNFSHGALVEKSWQKSYPILLRKAGYLTAFAGKFGFDVISAPKGKKRLPDGDFDRWGGGPGQTSYQTSKNTSMARYADEYPHSTLSYGAFGRDFIRDASKQEKPFCLSISFKAPHRPVSPDKKFNDVYAGKTFTRPPNYGREHGEHFSKQSRQGRQYERFTGWKYDRDYDGVMARYHQQVYGIDVAVGMIRKALDDHKVADRTVIIYTSDNGFLCGSHGYGSKVLPYEESARVPMMVYDPRHANSGKGITCEGVTGSIDVAPTILALAGLDRLESMDGRNLMTLYDDPAATIHESISLINVWGATPTHCLGVVTRDWKYLFWSYAEGDFKETEELYHTAGDPHELSNLAGREQYRKQLKAMRERYDAAVAAWKKESVDFHNYSQYGTIFDRSVPWREKRPLLGKQKK